MRQMTRQDGGALRPDSTKCACRVLFRLVIGLTVLSNVEKREVEMGVEAEPQKLFGLRELVRNRATGEPMARFNGTSPEMAQLYRFLLDNGVFVNLHWNQVMTNPRAVTG